MKITKIYCFALGLWGTFLINPIQSVSTLDVPVLLLIFNRPDVQQHVFDKIREVKPKQLFIAADGPREHMVSDQEKCVRARKVIEQIDWPCNVKTLFRDKNLGCDRAVSSAVTWFFEHVEQGIILEDDCIPSQSFFYFCQMMLERYKKEEKVWSVLGVNYYSGIEKTYFFSTVFLPTGWASWRRAWQYFDSEIIVQQRQRLIRTISSEWFFDIQHMARKAKSGDPLAWDYIWMFIIMMRRGLCVCPPVNMVDHSLGCGPEATHYDKVDPADVRCSMKAYDFDIKLLSSFMELKAKHSYMPNFLIPVTE